MPIRQRPQRIRQNAPAMLAPLLAPLLALHWGSCCKTTAQCPVAQPTPPADQEQHEKTPATRGWVLTGPWGAIERHDNDYVRVGELFYLVGGRNLRNGHIQEYFSGKGPEKPVQSYDPKTDTWTELAAPPIDLHHFQGVVVGTKIYAIGGATGTFPNEKATDRIYSYDTETNEWADEGEIPAERRRGSVGAVLVKGTIYLIGGANGGHSENSHALAWVDSYDPATKEWKVLADAPNPRQHFQAAAYGNEIYAMAGRKHGDTTRGHVEPIDVYNIATGEWRTLPAESNIPTPRSGAATVVYGNEAIVIGGQNAHLTRPTVEAFHFDTHSWRTLPSLLEGRHGVGAVVCGSGLYVAAGAGTLGGHSQFTSHEALVLDPEQPSCSPKLSRSGDSE